MIKKILLLALGLTPFLWGVLINWTLMNRFFPVPLFFISLAMLGLWALFAFLLSGGAGSARSVIVPLNLPALLVLLLIGFQERVLGAFWMNLAGIGTQFFYLPFLPAGYGLTIWNRSGIFIACCGAFLLLVGASWLGWRLRMKRSPSRQTEALTRL